MHGLTSERGVCETCIPPAVVNAAKTTCAIPYQCPAGSTCTNSDGCDGPDDCVQCPSGSVSLGGDCTECTGIGEVADPNQATCVACGPGKEPNTNRTACVDCTGMTYSQFAVASNVSNVMVVGPNAASCITCQAGEGPKRRRHHVRAARHLYSITGQCQECAELNVVSEDHQTCTVWSRARPSLDRRTYVQVPRSLRLASSVLLVPHPPRTRITRRCTLAPWWSKY